MAVRCGEMASTDTLLVLVPIGLYVAEEQVFAQHQQLYAGLHRKAGAHKVSSAMPLRVLLPRFVKETNAAPRLLATVAAAMIRLVSPEMERARTRSSEVSCRALIFIRVLSS